MTKNILLLAHLDESGNEFPKAAREALGAALELAKQLNVSLSIGLIGGDVQAAADSVANSGAQRLLAVTGPDFAQPRFASDLLAADALCRAADADLILAPATSRLLRALPGLAHRLNGRVDTHITSVQVMDGAVCATRWFYRQRIEGVFQRDAHPWILLLDSGCH